MTQLPQALQRADRHEVEFQPLGEADKVKLTVQIVQKLVAVPTRSGRTCSERDALRFIMLCRAQRVNPFANDAFLIGFDTKNGPVFQMVTAHQCYLKRAELHPEYDGMRSGIIARTPEGDVDVEGEILPPQSELIGGWASVHFKGRKIPTTRRIPLARFTQQIERQAGYGGPWRDDPGGMICKCAEADALRSSFPTMLGGLYLKQEVELGISSGQVSDVGAAAAGLVDVEPARKPLPEPPPDDDQIPMEDPTPVKPPQQPPLQTCQQTLAELVVNAGHDFDTFKQWGAECGQLSAPDSIGSFDDVPTAEVKRILRLQKLMLEGMAKVKGGGK